MIATTAFERVTGRLAEVTSFQPPNERGNWRCPAHDDSSASLAVSRSDKGVLVHCHAGCDTEAVLRELGLAKADLFDAPKERGREEPTATYRYVDEAGALLFEVLRFPGKQFRQRRPDGKGGWIWKLEDTRRPLFRLPEVLAAVAAGAPIFVVEGEKDVLAIERAGGVATCNAGGAGKWRLEYADALRGADVLIVADQDPPGIKHAADVEASLVERAKRVRVVAPASGKDAADHLANGHTLEEWLAVANPAALQRSLLGGMVRSGVPDPAMVHSWLYAGGLHTIQSEPGVGKSWLALFICLQLINEGWTCLYLDEEGGEELVAERLHAMGADPDVVDQFFFYFPFPQRDWTAADVIALKEAIEAAQTVGPVAVGVLDSLPDFLAAADWDEDRAKDVTRFIHLVGDPFREVGAALVVLDHLKKPEQGGAKRSRYARGSGAKLGKAHLTLLLEQEEEFDRHRSGKLRLWKTKDRRGSVNLPRLGTTPLAIRVDVDTASGAVTFDTSSGAQEESAGASGWDGPTKCMESVEAFLDRYPGERASTYKIQEVLRGEGEGYRKPTITAALERLRMLGRVGHMKGARNADLWWSLGGRAGGSTVGVQGEMSSSMDGRAADEDF